MSDGNLKGRVEYERHAAETAFGASRSAKPLACAGGEPAPGSDAARNHYGCHCYLARGIDPSEHATYDARSPNAKWRALIERDCPAHGHHWMTASMRRQLERYERAEAEAARKATRSFFAKARDALLGAYNGWRCGV